MKGTAIAQAGAKQAGHRVELYRTLRSDKFNDDQSLKSTAGQHVDAPALYLIKASRGKGLGMFARENIQKGTRILAEKPFFSLAKRPQISSSDPHGQNGISRAFDRLSAIERRKYMSLHCPKRSDARFIVSIYEANCYEMGSGTCICLDASRINHSCIPNAHYSWNDNIKRITVHAVKDIFKGEEITISYNSALRTPEERKRDLEPYVFKCSCPACESDTFFGNGSQVRRLQMLDLDRQIADYSNDPFAARKKYGEYDEMSAIRKLVNLIEKEGLVYGKLLAYHDAAECALKRGLRKRALKYASKEFEIELCCTGKDSPSLKKTQSFFLKIYFGVKGL